MGRHFQCKNIKRICRGSQRNDPLKAHAKCPVYFSNSPSFLDPIISDRSPFTQCNLTASLHVWARGGNGNKRACENIVNPGRKDAISALSRSDGSYEKHRMRSGYEYFLIQWYIFQCAKNEWKWAIKLFQKQVHAIWNFDIIRKPIFLLIIRSRLINLRNDPHNGSNGKEGQ